MLKKSSSTFFIYFIKYIIWSTRSMVKCPVPTLCTFILQKSFGGFHGLLHFIQFQTRVLLLCLWFYERNGICLAVWVRFCNVRFGFPRICFGFPRIWSTAWLGSTKEESLLHSSKVSCTSTSVLSWFGTFRFVWTWRLFGLCVTGCCCWWCCGR